MSTLFQQSGRSSRQSCTFHRGLRGGEGGTGRWPGRGVGGFVPSPRAGRNWAQSAGLTGLHRPRMSVPFVYYVKHHSFLESSSSFSSCKVCARSPLLQTVFPFRPPSFHPLSQGHFSLEAEEEEEGTETSPPPLTPQIPPLYGAVWGVQRRKKVGEGEEEGLIPPSPPCRCG